LPYISILGRDILHFQNAAANVQIPLRVGFGLQNITSNFISVPSRMEERPLEQRKIHRF